MNRSALVIGYGNALRSDDGVGWHAAELMSADPRLERVQVLQRHQLTPELALDVSVAAVVVLVDASSTAPAATVTVTRVDPADGGGSPWSHMLVPATLVALADELYGRAPDVYVVSIGVASFDVGDSLSPEVAGAMPLIVDTVVELLGAQALSSVADSLSELHDA